MKTLVTGATGFLGKRVVKKLRARGEDPILTSLSMGVDLRDFNQTKAFFEDHQPDVLLNCASFVGGIQFGYKYPADLFENNLLIRATEKPTKHSKIISKHTCFKSSVSNRET